MGTFDEGGGRPEAVGVVEVGWDDAAADDSGGGKGAVADDEPDDGAAALARSSCDLPAQAFRRLRDMAELVVRRAGLGLIRRMLRARGMTIAESLRILFTKKEN